MYNLNLFLGSLSHRYHTETTISTWHLHSGLLSAFICHRNEAIAMMDNNSQNHHAVFRVILLAMPLSMFLPDILDSRAVILEPGLNVFFEISVRTLEFIV
jgi:hypothetical protein